MKRPDLITVTRSVGLEENRCKFLSPENADMVEARTLEKLGETYSKAPEETS